MSLPDTPLEYVNMDKIRLVSVYREVCKITFLTLCKYNNTILKMS